MNLYDLMGPVAIGAGVGASYGTAQSHGTAFWVTLLVGAAAGVGAFIALRRLTLKAPEQSLASYYVATPVCVFLVTTIAAWAAGAIV